MKKEIPVEVKRMERKLFVVYFVLVILFVLALSACNSKSGQLNTIQPEKVVIIDSELKTVVDNDVQVYRFKYKVKRINYGVVDFMTSVNKYEAGDTIFYRF